MAQYGLTKEVIESGDLRVMLAIDPVGTENNKLFEIVRGYDDLIQVKEGKRNALTYNLEAVGRYNNLQSTLRELRPFLIDEQRVQGPCGVFQRGTCVIAGTAPNLDREFLKTAKEAGIPIIGLGNICYTDLEIDYWIGRQDAISYLPKPMETQRIQAFVNNDFIQEGLWDSVSKKQSNVTPASCVNVLGYRTVGTSFAEWLKNPAGLTDGGYASSFLTGISLAVVMGFHNVILTGVRLGGNVSDYFVFDEVPHAETIHRKAATYIRIRKHFGDVYKALTDYGIRIVGIGDIPLRIPKLSNKYMSRALHSTLSLTRRVDADKTRVTLPADSKRRYLASVRDCQAHIVTPPILLDHAKELIKMVPARFSTDSIKTAMENYETARIRPGGCTGCQKGKAGQPLYKVFEQGIKDGDTVLLAAWKEILPDQYILKANLMRGTVLTDLVFREDKADEEQKFKDAQI